MATTAFTFIMALKYIWFGLSSGHMYSDSRTWEVQVAVNGPSIILYYITKCRGWGLQPLVLPLLHFVNTCFINPNLLEDQNMPGGADTKSLFAFILHLEIRRSFPFEYS